jgi:hypothetical protein
MRFPMTAPVAIVALPADHPSWNRLRVSSKETRARYCPAAYTPDNGPYPAEVSCRQKIAPTPPNAPHQLFTELFQHSKPVDSADTSTSNGVSKADTQKPEPLEFRR